MMGIGPTNWKNNAATARANPAPSRALILSAVVLGVVFVLMRAETAGWWSFSDEVSKRVEIAMGAVTLAGAVLGMEATRQHWRIERSNSTLATALIFFLVGMFMVLPRLVDPDHGSSTSALELGGNASAAVVATMFLGHPKSIDRFRPATIVVVLATSATAMASIVALGVWPIVEFDDTTTHAVLLGVVAMAWFTLSLAALNRSYSGGEPHLRWMALLYVTLAVSAVARIVLIGSAPTGSTGGQSSVSGPIALLVGVGVVVYASIVELTRTVLREREATDRARAETNRAVDRLVEQTRAQHETVHDTRTAIAAIAGSLDLLHDDHPIDRTWLIGEIRSEVLRLRSIIESPRRVAVIESFSVADVLRPMISCYQVADHPVRLDGDPAVRALGRAGDTAEAVQNLLDNALRYADADSIDVYIRHDGETVQIEVCDDGVGIAPDEVDAVFEHGYRGRTARGPGTGLGLYLMRTLVTAQNGTVECVVSGDRGTRFVITLPAAVRRDETMTDPVNDVIDLRDRTAERPPTQPTSQR